MREAENMPFLILALIIVAAVIIAMLYLRRRKALKGTASQIENYQCSLFDEKDKREACERLMNQGEEK
jgi:hypothetical protein